LLVESGARRIGPAGPLRFHGASSSKHLEEVRAMTTHRGGTRVKGGFYWNLRAWSLHAISGAHGVLPGGEEARYAKVPALLVLVLAPVMGGLYVMFLPFVGFALVFRFLLEKAGVTLAKAAAGGARQEARAKKSR
jgi:hypothetical protein